MSEPVWFECTSVNKCLNTYDNRLFHKNRSIIITGRQVDTKIKHYFLINDFYPRAYVDSAEGTKKFQGVLKIKDEQKKHYLTDISVLTVYLKDTNSIYNLRKSYDKTFESDIPYESVFRSEKRLGNLFAVHNLENKLSIKVNNIEFTIISHTDIEVED